MTAGSEAPPRAQWPEPDAAMPAGALLTDVILATFRLNGRLQAAAQEMAAAGEMTAAWWQVIGGVLDEPRTVAEIGRRMGMTRQGVQRIADILVERGLAEYRDNPAHRRAKLLAPTEAGYWAVRRISLVQHPWANRVGEAVGAEPLAAALAAIERLVDVLEADEAGTSYPTEYRRTVVSPSRTEEIGSSRTASPSERSKRRTPSPTRTGAT